MIEYIGVEPPRLGNRYRPQRILCVCQGGNVRSVTLRFLFNYKYGQDALAMGWEPNTDDTKRMLMSWADLIVLAEESYRDRIPEEFSEKIVVYDIGPDRWFRSLDPELTELCDALIQKHLALSAAASASPASTPSSDPAVNQPTRVGRAASPVDTGLAEVSE